MIRLLLEDSLFRRGGMAEARKIEKTIQKDFIDQTMWTSHCKVWTDCQVVNIVQLHNKIQKIVLVTYKYFNEVELVPQGIYKWFTL